MPTSVPTPAPAPPGGGGGMAGSDGLRRRQGIPAETVAPAAPAAEPAPDARDAAPAADVRLPIWPYWTRTRTLCIVLIAGTAGVCVPAWQVLEQERAIRDWQPTRCVVHSSEAYDVAKDKGKTAQWFRKEWAPIVRYSYIWPPDGSTQPWPMGSNRTSSTVFWSNRYTFSSRAEASVVVRHFRPGLARCVAYVDPLRPQMSILVRQAGFRPYSWVLVLIAVMLSAVWYFSVELDWAAARADFAAVAPGDDARAARGGRGWHLPTTAEAEAPHAHAAWHAVPVQQWIKPPRTLLALSAAPAVWGAAACLAWQRFTSGPHLAGGKDQVFLFLAGGAVMLLRWVYQILLSAQVCEVELALDAPKLEVGREHTLRVRQARRRAGGWLAYESLCVHFECRETKHNAPTSQSTSTRPRRTASFRHVLDYTLAKNEAVPPGNAGVEACCSLTIPAMRMKKATHYGEVRYDWTLRVDARLRCVPFTYSVPISLEVSVPPEFLDLNKDEDDAKK